MDRVNPGARKDNDSDTDPAIPSPEHKQSEIRSISRRARRISRRFVRRWRGRKHLVEVRPLVKQPGATTGQNSPRRLREQGRRTRQTLLVFPGYPLRQGGRTRGQHHQTRPALLEWTSESVGHGLSRRVGSVADGHQWWTLDVAPSDEVDKDRAGYRGHPKPRACGEPGQSV
jgi:hypothetical protein